MCHSFLLLYNRETVRVCVHTVRVCVHTVRVCVHTVRVCVHTVCVCACIREKLRRWGNGGRPNLTMQPFTDTFQWAAWGGLFVSVCICVYSCFCVHAHVCMNMCIWSSACMRRSLKVHLGGNKQRRQWPEESFWDEVTHSLVFVWRRSVGCLLTSTCVCQSELCVVEEVFQWDRRSCWPVQCLSASSELNVSTSSEPVWQERLHHDKHTHTCMLVHTTHKHTSLL